MGAALSELSYERSGMVDGRRPFRHRSWPSEAGPGERRFNGSFDGHRDSGGAANTIPGTLFGLGHGPLKALSDAVLGHEEAIEGDPCYLEIGRASWRERVC